MIRYLKKLDWMLALYAILLVCFGLVSLYSSGAGVELSYFKKQIIWLILGIFAMVSISLFDYRILKNRQFPIMLLFITACLFLAGLFYFGVSARGTIGWYRFGPVAFEPVELTKIILILVLAKYFSMRHIEMYRPRHIIISGLYILIPSVIVLLQSEMGSVSVMLSIWLGVMLIAGIKLRHLATLGLLGIGFLLVGWNFVFQDYQRERILSFINPGSDPQGSGYNIAQALIAMGSAGLWGKGIGDGTQTQLGFLPETETDFIYAAITEEMGLTGSILIILCFILLIRRIMFISRNAENNFARLVAGSFSIMLLAQIFVNVGMNLGLFPITGIPLPFVSYGGSSLLSLFTMLGLLQSIKINN